MKHLKDFQHKKSYSAVGVLLILMLCIPGCAKNNDINAPADPKEKDIVHEQADVSKDSADNQFPSLTEVMDRILSNQGLEKAVDYESGIQDISTDTIVLMCKSENGKYETYGFISTDYGMNGILINNIIDGESNWNYFEEDWSYSDVRPTLEEKSDYEVIFTFMQENNGANDMRSIYFDTYDTGTMSIRD